MLETADAWSALILRLVAFFVGALMAVYAVIFSNDGTELRLAFLAFGAGFCGPTVVPGVVTVVRAMKGAE